MKKLLFLLLLTKAAAAQELDQVVTAFVNAGRFSGTVLVAQHGQLLLNKGYGGANDSGTVYQIASVTKQFTAAVILKLAAAHKLSLQDKLSQYFPVFPEGDSITIKHLLTHTSGLHNYTETDQEIAGADEKRIMRFLACEPLDFQPGEGWHYSNSNYAVLGYIIQKTSGMSYWQAVRHYIFEPAGMVHSGFDFNHLNSAEKAVTEQTPLDSTKPFSAGAIYSTVGDLYQWHQFLQQAGKMMEPAYQPCAKSNYGFGWQIDSIFGRKMVSHSGSITGFGSNIARITADDVCVVVLSNRNGSTSEVMNLTNQLLAALYHQPYRLPVKRVPVKVSEDVLKKYIGTYVVDSPHLVVEMTVEDGVLIARPQGGRVATMYAIDDQQFYIKEDEDTEIAFKKDGAELEIRQRNMIRTAKKRDAVNH